MDKRITVYGMFIWSLAILFFFYEYFLRIFLGTVASEITIDLNLSIRQFSFVGAAYYITYAIMQIPVGILTEKLGARLVLSVACLICSLGVFLMVTAQGFTAAFISRLAIGFGSSFGFVSLLVVALNWFPRKHFGFLCGLSLFLGAIGPMMAGAPLAHLVEHLEGDWRRILLWIGILGLLLSLFLALFMRSKPMHLEQRIIFITPHVRLRDQLYEMMKNLQAWFVVLCSSFLYVPLATFAAYFGTAYLQSRGLAKTDAAFAISMVWVGYAVGNPLIGKLSDKVKRRTPFLVQFSFLGCVVSTYLLYFAPTNLTVLSILFLLLGLATSSQGLSYALMIEHTPKKQHSAALGFNNAAGVFLDALIPVMIGFIIQAAVEARGTISPTPSAYLGGLTAIPILYGLSGILALFFLKETYCRNQHEVEKLEPLHKASDFLG